MLSNPTLEDAITKNRADKSNWQVYADWLLENGEKWGEVIVKSCSGKDWTDERNTVMAILDPLSDEATIDFDFGVVKSLNLASEEDPEEEDEEMAAILENLLRYPAGRYIGELTLGLPPRTPGDINWHFEDCMAAMAKAGPLPLLTSLDMTPNADHMDQRSWRRIGDISALWKTAPRLRELKMQGSAGSDGGTPLKMGEIDAPHLKRLKIISSGLSHVALMDLSRGNLPELEMLELYFGRPDYGNDCTLQHVERLVTEANLPKLQTLGIMNSEWQAEELIPLLAKAPLIKRIKHLDLSQGVLYTDAEALITDAKSFSHLESIKLNENYIPEDLAARLKRALPNVDLDEQREMEDEDYRYTAIGE